MELAAWGLAKALIPDMTNNTQSTIIQALSLFCNLLMISSSRSGPGVRTAEVHLQRVVGRFPACRRGDHNDTSAGNGQHHVQAGLSGLYLIAGNLALLGVNPRWSTV